MFSLTAMGLFVFLKGIVVVQCVSSVYPQLWFLFCWWRTHQSVIFTHMMICIWSNYLLYYILTYIKGEVHTCENFS